MLWHKFSFPNRHFLILVVRNSTRSSFLRHWRQKQRLPFQKLFILPLSWVTFLLVTVLWIVWICDCCFLADFLMRRALLVKNYQIKLLNKVWRILLVLCTWFNSFSIQLGAHQVNKILVCDNNQKPELEPWKKKAPEPHSWKPIPPEAELCYFYDGSVALNNQRCNRAHRRSRV